MSPDPWLSAAQAHDRALVRLESDIQVAVVAALGDVLAELWSVVLADDPSSVAVDGVVGDALDTATGLTAAGAPEVTGLERQAEGSWNAALSRWLRPVVLAGFARKYAAVTRDAGDTGAGGGGRLDPGDPVLTGWWDTVAGRLADTVDRLVAAVRGTVAAHPEASIPELRDHVARVLQLDAVTASVRADINKVEAELLDVSLGMDRRGELFAERLKVQKALFRWDRAAAHARALRVIAALPGIYSKRGSRLVDLARQVEPTGPRSQLEADLARIDGQLYRNPALGERAVVLRARRALLYKQAAASEETWRNTATRIARTESTSVLNGATYAAGQAMEQAQGVRLMKRWIATMAAGGGCDPRTRPTHCQANGQVVPLDQPFKVGGADLMFPADPSGPADEVIQCRCSHAVVTIEEDEVIARSLAASAAGGPGGGRGGGRPVGVPALVWGIASRLDAVPDRARALVAAVNELRTVCSTGKAAGKPVDADVLARACVAVARWDAQRVRPFRLAGPAVAMDSEASA